MNVYVVIQRGIYRHRIVGVYSTLSLAEDCAVTSINNEDDHYHRCEICEVQLDDVNGAAMKHVGGWCGTTTGIRSEKLVCTYEYDDKTSCVKRNPGFNGQ